MAQLSKRMQLLLDERRDRRLRAEAAERGVSVGALVRDAIDLAYPEVPADRRRAADELLAMEPMPVEDWPQIKREIESAGERSLIDGEP